MAMTPHMPTKYTPYPTTIHIFDLSSTFIFTNLTRLLIYKNATHSKKEKHWHGCHVCKKSHFQISAPEEKHVCESLRHGDTAHNWFAHYLWDIYGGFGHNGKIIQHTIPSHTQPSHFDLAVWTRF